ncbi:HAD superfamily hydrolase [Salinisphaera sp. PC39]|uniref:HAD-IA family hydrolase n=1 Tax=Salinisphaera sp. PC39 TaxID=1304156 RepID=UPI00333ED12A
MTHVDWNRVDTVLLDMDGTVLDLHFDDRFWQGHLPRRYAERHGLALSEAERRLAPVFAENAGRLNWYCTDFWGRVTGLDLIALKREIAEHIRPLPGALGFLDRMVAAGRPMWLVTNAHPDSVTLKLERTGLGPRFARVISSHDLGMAKEEPGFWDRLADRHPVDLSRALFVDDSPAVVAAAHAHGIGQVVALSRPDSRGGRREHTHRPAAERLADLLPPAR